MTPFDHIPTYIQVEIDRQIEQHRLPDLTDDAGLNDIEFSWVLLTRHYWCLDFEEWRCASAAHIAHALHALRNPSATVWWRRNSANQSLAGTVERFMRFFKPGVFPPSTP